MSGKTFFLSASLICLSLLPSAAFAEESALIISKPLAPPQTEKPFLLAKSDSAAHPSQDSAAKAASKLLNKKTREAQSAAAKTAKEPKAAKTAKEPKAAAGKSSRTEKTASKAQSGPAKSKQETQTAEKRSRRKVKSARAKTAQPTTMERMRRQNNYKPMYGNENCSCISGFYCVGPRGGHYCYSSGGNKRYLKHN